MKNIPKKALIIFALLSAPLSALAAKKDTSKPEYQLQEYRLEDLTIPIPSKVEVPRVSGRLLGHKVRMSFEVRADGRAHNIRQQGISPDQGTNDLAATMKIALLSWEFEPALDNHGNAIAVKVIMPVHVVKKGNRTTALTSIILDNRSNRFTNPFNYPLHF